MCFQSLAATNVVAIGKATAFDELFESSYNVDRDLDGIPAYLDDYDYNEAIEGELKQPLA